VTRADDYPPPSSEWLRKTARDLGRDPLELATSQRFRGVSTAYAKRVAEAYGGDLLAAAAALDAEVAEEVATWETENGLPVTDWAAVGGHGKGDR
jgi:hypothetical protein